MAQINSQVRQLREQAGVLRGAQSSLLSYQGNLNAHWRGAEMAPVNQNIDYHMTRLALMAADLESIGGDIIREAEAIRRAEELAEVVE